MLSYSVYIFLPHFIVGPGVVLEVGLWPLSNPLLPIFRTVVFKSVSFRPVGNPFGASVTLNIIDYNFLVPGLSLAVYLHGAGAGSSIM